MQVFYNETHGFEMDGETYFQHASRALAARLLHEGVDGIYTFNWYTNVVARAQLLPGLVTQGVPGVPQDPFAPP